MISDIAGMLPFLIPALIIQLVLMIVALVDIFKRGSIRGNRVIWVLVIIIVNVIGPILYFIFGRKESAVDGD